MRQIEIEVNGKKRPVTLEQLQTLVSRRFIKPDATAWVDDEELKVAELINRPSTGEKTNGTGTSTDQIANSETSEVPPLRAETPVFRNVDVPSTMTAMTESPKATSSKNLIAFAAGIIGLVMVVAIVIVLYYGTHKSNPEITRDAKPPVSKSQVEENEGDDGTVQQGETEFDVSEENNADNEDRRGDETTPSSAEAAASGKESWRSYWDCFDRNWETIPNTYIGNSCESLYHAVSQHYDNIEKQLSQGEFETLAEYHSRIEREEKDIKQSLISGNVHFGSTVGFPIVREKFFSYYSKCNTITTQYNADRKSWVISIDFGGSGVEIKNEKKVFVPIRRKTEIEEYAAVNGFNARFEITKTTYDDEGVCVEYTEPRTIPDKSGDLSLLLSDVPLEFAKEMKGKISGFCVCDVVYRDPYYGRDHTEPKFSSPYEYVVNKRYIFVSNLEFWFYDVTTGKVIAKFSLDEALSGTSKNFADAKVIAKQDNLGSDSNGNSDSSGPMDSEFESSQSSVNLYATSPFVSDDLRIPVDYQGHDPVEVVNALSQSTFSIPSKTFSNINEYRNWLIQRAISLKGEPLYGSMTFDSQLACVMKNASEADGDEEVISTEYQESSKTMTIRRSFKFSRTDYRIETKPRGGFGGGGFGPLRYNSGADNSSESAPDVFFSLCLYRGKAYGLDIENLQVKKRSDPQFDHWTLTEVSYEDYNRLKGSIRVLCVFQLWLEGSDYSGFYESSNSALTYPSCAIATVDPEFWLYDGKTGVILAKFKAEDFFNGRRIALSKTSKEALSRPPEEAEGILGEKFSAEPEPPTWDDVLQEAVDSPEKWESKKPTITIPDDAASLEEALSKTSKGDVILVRSTEKPILLKGKKAARGESSEVLIDHAVAVIGESNATVEIDAEETLRIDSRDLVAFKGLSFSARKSPSANSIKPLIAVANDSKVKFKDCEFQGNDIEETTGVAVEGEFANVSFWKCQFQQFGDSGVRVQDSANATLEYCQFLSKNRYGVSSFSGAAIKVDKCRFDGNVTGFIAEGGGGVVASNSFFSGNRSNWSISSGSKDASDTKEGNVIEK